MKMQSSLLPQLQQKLKLSPQIIQSIEILQLPLMALVEHIQQEMVDNPVLEEVVDEKKDENLKESADAAQTTREDEKVTKLINLLRPRIGVSSIHRQRYGGIRDQRNAIRSKKH